MVELGPERHASALLGLQRIVLRIDQPELERRDLAKHVLDLSRILHARQLHVDAIQSLALHDRLGDAEFIHAVHQRGAILLERVVLARFDLCRTEHHVDLGTARPGAGLEVKAVIDPFEHGYQRAAVALWR